MQFMNVWPNQLKPKQNAKKNFSFNFQGLIIIGAIKSKEDGQICIVTLKSSGGYMDETID